MLTEYEVRAKYEDLAGQLAGLYILTYPKSPQLTMPVIFAGMIGKIEAYCEVLGIDNKKLITLVSEQVKTKVNLLQ